MWKQFQPNSKSSKYLIPLRMISRSIVLICRISQEKILFPSLLGYFQLNSKLKRYRKFKVILKFYWLIQNNPWEIIVDILIFLSLSYPSFISTKLFIIPFFQTKPIPHLWPITLQFFLKKNFIYSMISKIGLTLKFCDLLKRFSAKHHIIKSFNLYKNSHESSTRQRPPRDFIIPKGWYLHRPYLSQY